MIKKIKIFIVHKSILFYNRTLMHANLHNLFHLFELFKALIKTLFVRIIVNICALHI